MPHVTRDDGARIWWEAVGPEEAPAVVLVMGLGYPAAMWWRQVPALAERYRVITVDNRGAGRTGDVVGAPYSIETMADDVMAVIRTAGVSRAHLVGFSMGGMIAQEIALRRPELVASLVLMATHCGAEHATSNPEVASLLTARQDMTAREAAELSIPFNYATTTPRSAIEEDWAVRLPLSCTVDGFYAQMIGAMAWSSRDRLPALATPVLVLHGEMDALIPPENGRVLAASIPDARYVGIPDANHILTTDQQEAVGAVLMTWLERH